MNHMLESFSQDLVAVVIPAYEPDENTLVPLVKEVAQMPVSILVVDDGSGRDYAQIWSQLYPYATVLHHEKNRGKGAALKTAFAYIRTELPDIRVIVTMDADGQHLPADMLRVCSTAWEHPGTLVLGSRSLQQDVPLRSKIGNTITRGVFAAVSKNKVRDTQTGLRAFSSDLLECMLDEEGNRYEYEMNVLLHAKRNNIPILEVPIRTVYMDEKNSTSHFDTLRDSLRIYKHIFKFASASFVSFLADYLFFVVLHLLLPAGTVFLVLANVLARFGSAALNYFLNSRVVFGGNQTSARSALQYAALALGILLANSILLTLFTNGLGIPANAAKILTEITLFVISFTVQSQLIFAKKPHDGQKGGAAYELRANVKKNTL